MTAYNQYAIDAFDRGAVDYLLKPIVPERLAATVKRLKSRLASGTAEPGDLAAIIEQLRAKLPAESKQRIEWITASVGKETRLILVDDVAYFKADDKYTVVATADGEALIRKPIRELLDGARSGNLQAGASLDHRQPARGGGRSPATTAAAARCG